MSVEAAEVQAAVCSRFKSLFSLQTFLASSCDQKAKAGDHQKPKSSFADLSKRKKKRDRVVDDALETFLDRPFKLTWPEVFYCRLLGEIDKDTLTRSQVQFFREIAEAYIQWHGTEKDRRALVAEATELVNFFKTHEDDPDNSLIGLRVSRRVLDQLTTLQHPGSLAPATDTEADPTSRMNLARKVMEWHHMPQDAVKKEIAELVELIKARGIVCAKRGQLMIVQFVSEQTQALEVVFARVAQVYDNEIAVFTSFDEKTRRIVRNNNIYIPDAEMLTYVHSPNAMHRLVENPIDSFYATMLKEIQSKTSQFLEDQGINLELVSRAATNMVGISEMAELQRIDNYLVNTDNAELQKFLSDLVQFAKDSVYDFMSHLDEYRFFIPAKDSSITQLNQYVLLSKDLAMDKLKRLHGTCISALDQLNLDCRNLVTGVTKRELSTWWLEEIETNVRDFLQNLGYHVNAVPENYIETPPESLSMLRANQMLLRDVLKPGTDKYHTKEFIKNLKDRIYSRLDEFIYDCSAYIAKELSLKIPPRQTISYMWLIETCSSRSVSSSLGDDHSTPRAAGALPHQSMLVTQSMATGLCARLKDQTPGGFKDDAALGGAPQTQKKILKKLSASHIFDGDDKIMAPAPTLSTTSFNLDEVERVFTDMRSSINECRATELDGLIKDVKYVIEMKILEEDFSNSEKVIKLSKVVPISGLILNRFHRYENEINTALDVWGGGVKKVESSSSLVQRKSNHSNTLGGGSPEFEMLKKLKSGSVMSISASGGVHFDKRSQIPASASTSSVSRQKRSRYNSIAGTGSSLLSRKSQSPKKPHQASSIQPLEGARSRSPSPKAPHRVRPIARLPLELVSSVPPEKARSTEMATEDTLGGAVSPVIRRGLESPVGCSKSADFHLPLSPKSQGKERSFMRHIKLALGVGEGQEGGDARSPGKAGREEGNEEIGEQGRDGVAEDEAEGERGSMARSGRGDESEKRSRSARSSRGEREFEREEGGGTCHDKALDKQPRDDAPAVEVEEGKRILKPSPNNSGDCLGEDRRRQTISQRVCTPKTPKNLKVVSDM